MAFNLPSHGEENYDTKLNASISAVKATADAAETPTGSQSKADAAQANAQTYADSVGASARSYSDSLATNYAHRVPTWVTGRDYVVGELVTNAGLLYRVTTAHTSGASFNAGNFTQVGGGAGSASGVPTVVNVKDAAYGAVGDGVADDTTAIQAAITAAKAASGPAVVYFPLGTYLVTSTLDVSNSALVTLRGSGGHHIYNFAGPRTYIKYTGTGTGNIVNAEQSVAFTIDNLSIRHTSSSFTGTIVKAGNNQGGAPAYGFTMRDSYLGSTSTSITTATALNLDGIVEARIENSAISNSAVGVLGKMSGTSAGFSNAVLFIGGRFENCTVAVKNPMAQWSFYGTVFEPCTATGVASPVQTTTTAAAQNLAFYGCGFWDSSSPGSYLDVSVWGLVVSGCYISNNGTFLTLQTANAGSGGVVLQGNYVDNGVLYKLSGTGTVKDFIATGNYYRDSWASEQNTDAKVVHSGPRGYQETAALGSVVSGTLTLSRAATQTATLAANVTTVNMPAGIVSGQAFTFSLLLTQDATGSRTVTWPGAVHWGAAGAPVLSTAANKTDWLTFTTLDGGSNWNAVLSGKGF